MAPESIIACGERARALELRVELPKTAVGKRSKTALQPSERQKKTA